MNNITTKTKIILFAAILIAMILPFSSIEMVDAAKEKANKKDKEKKDKEAKKEKKSKKEKKEKKEKKNKIKGNGFTKTADFSNPEADKINEELSQMMVLSIDESSEPKKFSKDKMKKIKELQKKLDKSQDDLREKLIDKELRKELKKAKKQISKSDIPFTILGTGINHVYIQLPIESTLEEREKYEAQSIELVRCAPYLLEYGEGAKRMIHTCLTTSATDCATMVGGLKIQIERNFLKMAGTCSLSIPIKKDGVDGFLTAAHCFNGHSEDVYQPTLDDQLIGYSSPEWRSLENDGECDCAWIKDNSVKKHQTGTWAKPGYYLALADAHMPKIGDIVKMRGIHNSDYRESYTILRDDIVIDDGWFGVRTINLMSFKAPAQPGDSGGTVYDFFRYMGIVIATKQVDDEMHVVFVPWDHIIENISGLTFTPHPYFLR